MKSNSSRTYQAYLLRLWRGGEEKPWRVSLTHVGPDDRAIHFPDMESLWAFLQAQTGPTPDGYTSPKQSPASPR